MVLGEPKIISEVFLRTIADVSPAFQTKGETEVCMVILNLKSQGLGEHCGVFARKHC